ncbi:MAG TPA: DUF2490 domain-containing protein [Bacteroidia bacterium]|nr:DUF2490 domain-containing protein [Bacteroidia bacterium]
MTVYIPSPPSPLLLQERGLGGEVFQRLKISLRPFYLSLFFFLGFLSPLHAQYDDAGLWTTINIEKKLKNNFRIFLTEEFRLRENFSEINLFYTDVGVGYRPYSFLKLDLSYRMTEKKLITDFYSIRHRLMLDITLKKKYGNFDLAYRHRLQREVRNINSSENGRNPEWYSRNKFTAKYDTDKKYTPYVSCEFRYQIDDPRNMESDQTWHRARFVAGLEYELNKKNTFGLYYLIQHEWNVSLPEKLYIIGLEYSLTL